MTSTERKLLEIIALLELALASNDRQAQMELVRQAGEKRRELLSEQRG